MQYGIEGSNFPLLGCSLHTSIEWLVMGHVICIMNHDLVIPKIALHAIERNDQHTRLRNVTGRACVMSEIPTSTWGRNKWVSPRIK